MFINLRRPIAKVGGALGPPIVKGGNPREARREKCTLKWVDPEKVHAILTYLPGVSCNHLGPPVTAAATSARTAQSMISSARSRSRP